MVEIQSKEVIDKVSDELKVQPAMAIPRTLAKDIQLVYAVNDNNLSRVLGKGSSSSSGTTTIFTSDATKKDTFITGISLSYIKDGDSDNTNIQVNTTINGAVVGLIDVRGITLTAMQDHVHIHFSPPVKIDRDVATLISKSFTLGVMVVSGLVFGYTTDAQ